MKNIVALLLVLVMPFWLAYAGDEKQAEIEKLVQELNEAQDWRPVVDKLAAVGDPAVEYLDKLIDEEGPSLTDFKVFGKVGSEKAITALLKRLTIPQPYRQAVVLALCEIGEDAVPRIVAELKSQDKKRRAQAAYALASIGSDEAIDALIALYETEKEDSLKNGLLIWFAGSKDKRIVDILVKEAASDNKIHVMSALASLKATADPETLAELRLLLKDEQKDMRVRVGVAAVLAALGDKEGPVFLHRALDNKKPDVVIDAIYQIGKMGDTSFQEPLLSKLEDGDSKIRRQAALALGDLGDDKAIPALEKVLADKEPEVRESAQFALRAIRVRQAMDEGSTEGKDRD